MSAGLLLVCAAIYVFVAQDLARNGNETQIWIGGGYFFYACAGLCFAMAARQ